LSFVRVRLDEFREACLSSPLPKIYLARHGETEWSLSGQHTGLTDIPLTERGEEEGRKLGLRLQGHPFTLILTSPLRRAQKTCELATYGQLAEPDADLMEWRYGDYEGLTTPEIQAKPPGWHVFQDGCPGGETASDVGRRVDRVIARARAAGGDVLLFGHGHCLRVLAARWLGLPPGDGRLFRLSTATLSILSYEHDLKSPVILLWNDDNHLSETNGRG
jgi:probable phosphoglycerate mutase